MQFVTEKQLDLETMKYRVRADPETDETKASDNICRYVSTGRPKQVGFYVCDLPGGGNSTFETSTCIFEKAHIAMVQYWTR